MNKIDKYLPEGKVAREIQVKAFDFYVENWDKKVILIKAPTGSGKSILAYSFGKYSVEQNYPAAIAIHRKNLQDQYKSDFPSLQMLKGMSSYICRNQDGRNCRQRKMAYKKICTHEGAPSCNWFDQMKRCADSDIAIYNLHSYYHNAQYKSTLIVDECHSLIPFLTEMASVTVKKEEMEYPEDIENLEVAKKWVNSACMFVQNLVAPEPVETDDYFSGKTIQLTQDIEKLEELLLKLNYIRGCLETDPSNYIIRAKVDWLGKAFVTFAPKTLGDAGKLLWPSQVKKIVMMSATMNEIDLKNLGFTEKDVAVFDGDSPIPPANRPFKFVPVCNMSSKKKDETFPQLVQAISAISVKHSGQNGVIHTTYDIAKKLKSSFSDWRFIYHDPKDAQDKLQSFLTGPKGRILVACGMEEGLDLKGDLCDWQIITKAMYPHLGDVLWEWKMKNANSEYIWETIRKIIQQTGRNCRGPTDRGITYFLDASGERLFTEEYAWMWPDWFLKAARVSTLEKVLK